VAVCGSAHGLVATGRVTLRQFNGYLRQRCGNNGIFTVPEQSGTRLWEIIFNHIIPCAIFKRPKLIPSKAYQYQVLLHSIRQVT
jgi:hypothetical protein